MPDQSSLQPSSGDLATNPQTASNPKLPSIHPPTKSLGGAGVNFVESLNPPLEPVEPDAQVGIGIAESMDLPTEYVPPATAVTESLNPPLEPVEPDFLLKASFATMKDISAGLIDLHDAPAYQASTLARQHLIRSLQQRLTDLTKLYLLRGAPAE
jgi:hypothetical protein